uniref:Sulfatase N-terminal domain-containing protein n=2 Tax=Plectus sambesii TaxID=2011161 RepID=A0A914VUW6_9BILA
MQIFVNEKIVPQKQLLYELEKTDITAAKPTCELPRLDPFDESIRYLIRHAEPLVCPRLQPDLFFIADGLLYMNESESSAFSDKSLLSCTYMCFDREASDGDFEALLEPTKQFVEPIRLHSDYVQVRCTYEQKFVYGETLVYPVDRLNMQQWKNVSDENLSVLLMFIDSISLSSFKRHLPLTAKYVTEQMNFTMFNGYNKVADNSFPNVMPLLTGKRVFNQQNDMPAELLDDVAATHLDHWPFIWKDFAANGYSTVFTEDTPDMGMFRLGAKGFLNKPLDYYYHNFWVMLGWQDYPQFQPTAPLCAGNKPRVKIQLDLVKSHLTKYSGKRQFIYSYWTELSHDQDYEVEKGDVFFRNFFREMHEGGYLNKTAVLFLSDHGHRSSLLTTTLIGLLEERMPFLGIYFPQWFYRQYPDIQLALKDNADHRLTSHFDTYETLRDILTSNYDGQQRNGVQRGQSQLYPIPANRTCATAGIPLFYCSCQQMKWNLINESSADSQQAANALVAAINTVLWQQYRGLCANFSLDTIVAAEQLLISSEDQFHWTTYRMTIVANPLKAKFQALIKKVNGSTFSLHSDVSRQDRYGSQSHCISDKVLKKMCICQ